MEILLNILENINSSNYIYIITTFIFIIGFISSVMVLLATNPVHSILYLIIVFISVISYFFLISVEFLALVFLIVYVGAIAVLFLFIVMMLDIKVIQLKENFTRYIPIGSLVILAFLFEMYYIVDYNIFSMLNFSTKNSNNLTETIN
jgi:NADH:ubiquinone oxidoreductase subunit 6 (subunit J)